MSDFPSSLQIIEMNRQAAAEAFSGYAPRMMLAVAACLAVATAGVLLVIRLHELDLQLAARLV
ncbi:hypothetical protein GRZ55_11365 [Chelativorans sp. ZYF759]|uniref:hypothetical protein n=1 Tax=Chelativorans sp. ZYF759 TaxID=2692213 RepID=UPI00145C50E9|nr:hypothetical protein [Chelativorans sp. ZYF759]NMG39843.1 hypothetical protein [Chelativorans sp. ZYF759]